MYSYLSGFSTGPSNQDPESRPLLRDPSLLSLDYSSSLTSNASQLWVETLTHHTLPTTFDYAEGLAKKACKAAAEEDYAALEKVLLEIPNIGDKAHQIVELWQKLDGFDSESNEPEENVIERNTQRSATGFFKTFNPDHRKEKRRAGEELRERNAGKIDDASEGTEGGG